MGKNPAFLFYPNDYLRDTQAATPSVRGIWMDLLCAMWWSQTRGVLTGTEKEMCRYGRCGIAEWRQFVELNSRQNVADVTFCDGNVTVANRRMVREERARKLATCRKSRERERKRHADVTRASPSTPSTPSPVKKKNIVGDSAPTLPLGRNGNGNSPVKTLVLYWSEVFERVRGRPPVINWGKHMKAAKTILATHDMDTAKWMVTELIEHPSDQARERGWFDLSVLIGSTGNTILARRGVL